jgi:uncharacterized membrane protein YdbT with pleckstrin-like domain
MGSYVENTLLPGEEIIFETKYHWLIYFLGPIGIFLSLITIGWFLVVIVIAFPFIFMLRTTSEFAVTNKRVIIKSGWIARRTVEMMLSKVESLDVNQGLIGRWCDYGSITIRGTGGTREKFSMVEQPLLLRRAVQSNQT